MELSTEGKVKIHWEVSPYDFSKEKSREIALAFSNMKHIPLKNIKVVPNFIIPNGEGEMKTLSEGVIDNIQDPAFQQKLFKEWININNIQDCDLNQILAIDKEINEYIDYQVYDKYRRFSIKWMKWSNFQSYGKDNYFDFRTLKGLTLLNGEPANQSGKTTFAVDLLHFLLFGKSPKWVKQEGIFNDVLPDATTVEVEACLTIENEDYVIKRVLSRPQLSRRSEKSKVTQKVEYYRIVGGDMVSLDDCDIELETGKDTRDTNKIIKESIGREEDFDLIMCVTGSNLDALVEEKGAERGRLFARWIGLLPLEKKDQLARDTFNNIVKPKLLSNTYSKQTLLEEIVAFESAIKEKEEENKSLEKIVSAHQTEVDNLKKTLKDLMDARISLDSSVMDVDISTLNHNIEVCKADGVNEKYKLDELEKKIANFGVVDFSVEKFDEVNEKRNSYILKKAELTNEYQNIQKTIETLKKGEYCPTCGKKMDDVDNSEQIAKKETELKELVERGKENSKLLEDYTAQYESLKANRERYTEYNSYVNQKPVLELKIEKLRGTYKDLMATKKAYERNAEAIDKNNKLNTQINNTESLFKSKEDVIHTNIRRIDTNNAYISQYKNNIEKNRDLNKKLDSEEKFIFNWKTYLEMVGKNGISKMVMRKTLPIINAKLIQLLEGVCDFDISININARNEIAFNIIRHGIESDLNSGSGFERTAAALALRCVLSDISTIPKLNFIVLDELLGRVAKSNFDNMYKLYERIAQSYDFIIHITHIDEVKDWHNNTITVTKTEGGVSSLLLQ